MYDKKLFVSWWDCNYGCNSTSTACPIRPKWNVQQSSRTCGKCLRYIIRRSHNCVSVAVCTGVSTGSCNVTSTVPAYLSSIFKTSITEKLRSIGYDWNVVNIRCGRIISNTECNGFVRSLSNIVENDRKIDWNAWAWIVHSKNCCCVRSGYNKAICPNS